MPFYEIIYEPGTKSVAQYADDDEALTALSAHHERAVNGQSATPMSTPRNDLAPGEFRNMGNWVAERVKKVLVYDEHPSSYMESQLLSTAEARKEVDSILKDIAVGDQVSMAELVSRVRAISDPVVPDPKVHESQFKMKEARELDLSSLEA
jgi:hypothetical protein